MFVQISPLLLFALLANILDRFCFGLRLIQVQNKPAGYHSGSGTCHAKTISYQDISSHFFVPITSYHFSGHLVPSFIGFNSLMRLFVCQNLLFKSVIIQENDFDQMHIGKFYHLNCNTVPYRLFNSVIGGIHCVCLYLIIYIYIQINIIIIIIL